MSADLRALAAEALRNYSREVRSDWDHEGAAAATLAAVLPEHRRMVLDEAAEALDNEELSDARGLEYAANLLRRLAAAAPPASLSVPVPAGNAPAVPEEAGGQRAGQGDALNLYEVKVENEGDFRESLRQYDSRHLGHLVARRVSAVRALVAELRKIRADRDRLAAQVAHYQDVIVPELRAWREATYESASIRRLAAAVDALSDAGTQPCPTPSDAKSGTDQTEDDHG